MTRRKVLTDLKIKAIKPVEGKRIATPDTEVRGLYIRTSPTGHKSFTIVARRPGGQQLWREVGVVGVLTLAEARERARQGIQAIKKGDEPWPEVAAPDTFGAIAARFIKEYAKPRNKSAGDTEKLFARLVLPHWKNRLVASITRRDVIALLDTVAVERGGLMANRTLAAVRKLFAWALSKDIVPATPVAGVAAPGVEVSRDRVLNDGELVEVWKAADAYVRLLILLGQRRTETAAMRWQDLVLDGKAPVWTIPASVAKSGKEHIVPLAPEAVAILKSIDRIKDGPFVFSNDGETVATNFGKRKAKLDAAILAARIEADPEAKPMPEWRLHDLRRSLATGLQRLGVALPVTEAVLGHTSGTRAGVVGIYQRHDYSEEKRAALTLWARHVMALVAPGPSNVVELTTAA